jgi:hypothetical protein
VLKTLLSVYRPGKVSPLESVDWDDVDRCMGGYPSEPKDSACTGVKDAPEVREAEAALNSAQIAIRFGLAQENRGLQESSSDPLLLPKAPHTNELSLWLLIVIFQTVAQTTSWPNTFCM